MLPNEEFALACRAYYEEQGLIVDKTNGQFAHCPLPRDECDTGYYLFWEHHQHQGLLQSKDLNKKCFFTPDTRNWLLTADYFPDNFFELWDIYDEFKRSEISQMLTPEAIAKRTITQRNQRKGKVPREFHTKEAKLRRKCSNSGGRGRSSKEAILRQAATLKKTLSSLTPLQRSARVHYLFKPIEITFPTGRVGVYPSVSIAAIALGIASTTPRGWVTKGTPVLSGPNKGYSARYL
jgi:hypothetical protein